MQSILRRKFLLLVIFLMTILVAVYQNCGKQSTKKAGVGGGGSNPIVNPPINFIPPAGTGITTRIPFETAVMQDYDDGRGAVYSLKLSQLGNFGRGDFVRVETSQGNFPSGTYRVLHIGRDGRGGEADAQDAGYIINLGVSCTSDCSLSSGTVSWTYPPVRNYSFQKIQTMNYQNYLGSVSALLVSGRPDLMVGDRIRVVTTAPAIGGVSIHGLFKIIHVSTVLINNTVHTVVDVGVKSFCTGNRPCTMSGTISFATLDSIEVNYDWLSANHYKKLNEPFTYAPHTTTDAPMGVGDYVTVESLSGQSHDGLYRVRNRGADGYDQASDYRWIRSLVGLDLGCSSGIDCGIGTGKIKLSHPPQKTYTGAFYHENFHDGFGEVLAFRTSGANDLMPGDHVYIKSSEGMPWEVVGKVIHHTADDQGNLDTVINIGLRSPCVVSALPRKYCSVEGTVALIPAPILLRNNRIITETGDVEAIELDLIQ